MPFLPAGTAMGTLRLPVPVWRSGENVSPSAWIAPPPLGWEMTWLAEPDLFIDPDPSVAAQSPGAPTPDAPVRAIAPCRQDARTLPVGPREHGRALATS